jgi:carbon storage regulator CsrA
MIMSSDIEKKPSFKNPKVGQLILSRYAGESIMIGENAGIVIRVLNIDSKGIVELAIEAPKELPIWREELYRHMKIKGLDLKKRNSRLNTTSQSGAAHVDSNATAAL